MLGVGKKNSRGVPNCVAQQQVRTLFLCPREFTFSQFSNRCFDTPFSLIEFGQSSPLELPPFLTHLSFFPDLFTSDINSPSPVPSMTSWPNSFFSLPYFHYSFPLSPFSPKKFLFPMQKFCKDYFQKIPQSLKFPHLLSFKG